MTEDYSKRADLDTLMGEDLKKKLGQLIESDPSSLVSKVQEAITEVKTDYDESGVLESVYDQLERVFTPGAGAYKVSRVYEPLIDSDYRVLSDGLIVLGGEANSGKTTIMTDIAKDLLQHNETMCALIYSLDDGGVMTMKRIISQLLERDLLNTDSVPHSDIQRGGHVTTLNRIYVQDSITLHNIEKDVQRIKKATGCTSVFIGIDYLQIIPAPSTGGVREGVNQVVKTLKDIQKRLSAAGCILFLLSQLNRAGSDDPDRYNMSRFRETSEIENQADAAMLMIQDKGDQDDGDKLSRRIRLVKNKKGKRGNWWTTSLVFPSRTISPLQDYTLEGKDPTRGKENTKKKAEARLNMYEGNI